MKKPAAVLILLSALVSVPLASMDWPSPSGRVTANFGENVGGLPQLGVSFESSEPVLAADNGELLYRRREGDNASRLPSPLGSWAALDHGDGIISIYGRFDDKSAPGIPDRAVKGSRVGNAGISGWSNQSGVYFQLFDRKERRWINPSMIITPAQDTQPPVILSVKLRDSEGNAVNLAAASPRAGRPQSVTLRQGRYAVIVEASDTVLSTNESPLAPYRIICSLNGGEAGSLNFENYSARGGSLVVYRNGLVPARKIYAPFPSYEVADVWFSRGQASLEIIAQDIAGNAGSAAFRLNVE